MAAAQVITDTNGKCVICTEKYSDPCTLHCNHTFCRKCICKYLQTKQAAVDSKAISCPVCRLSTDIPYPDQPVEHWLEQLNPVLQVSADNVNPGTDTEERCFLCKEKEETVQGTIWCHVCEVALCETCSKPHSLIPSTRDHDVTDLSGGKILKMKRKVKCKEHTKLDVEFCCKNCGTAVCQTCCILHHRKCDNVVTIASMIPEMSRQLKKNSEELSKKTKYLTSAVSVTKLSIAEAQRTRNDLQAEVEHFSQRAHALVTEKIENVTYDLEERLQRRMKPLEQIITIRELEVQKHRERMKMIDQALENQGEVELFGLFQSIQTEDQVEKSNPVDPVTIPLKTDFDVLESAMAMSIFLEPNKDSSSLTPQGTVTTSRATDIVVLMANGIETCVVTDERQYHVKALYMQQNKTCEFIFVLESYAWGITEIAQCQVAISIPMAKKIVLFKVSSEFQRLSTVTTIRDYYGLSRVNDMTLAAGSHKRIDILDVSGNILKTLSNTFTERPMYIMTTVHNSLLVSDGSSTSVYISSTDEKQQLLCSPKHDENSFRQNSGTVMTTSGEILVADKQANKVILLSEKGEVLKNVLTAADGIFQPLGLYLFNGRLYVTQNSGPIMIFKFP